MDAMADSFREIEQRFRKRSGGWEGCRSICLKLDPGCNTRRLKHELVSVESHRAAVAGKSVT
jgi:hypothetical protein